LVNGNGENNMEEVRKYGQMDPFMKEIGYKAKPMVMEDWYIQGETIIKGNGLTINAMVMENT
jgi:hypothetical protein